MLQKTNEQINVLVAFMKNKVMPLSFEWAGRNYSIDKVNMAYSSRVGRKLWHYFSVASAGSYFKLAFDSENNNWQIQEADYNQ